MASDKATLNIAAKALIINDKNEVLLARESSSHPTNTQAGLYQVIGGRIEPEETFIEGLKREVMEETGLQVEPLYPVQIGEWWPKIKGVSHHIVAIFMACKIIGGQLALSDEHDDYQWFDLEKLNNLPVMEPDKSIISSYLKSRISR